MAEPLHNPEIHWHKQRVQTLPGLDELRGRIGDFDQATVMSGGLANLNLNIDGERVLRVYQRDQKTLSKELSLLQRKWEFLRVPKVFKSGSDYILMEFVKYEPIVGLFTHGRALGKAAAEIHLLQFSDSGDLDSQLKLVEEWPKIDEMIVSGIKEYSKDHTFAGQIESWIAINRESITKLCAKPVLQHADFKVSNLHWTGSLPLVLDWEFAFSGPRLMDVGQLFRWGAPIEFKNGFFEGYNSVGENLPENWLAFAHFFDLVNLITFATKPGVVQAAQIASERRIAELVELIVQS